MKNLILTFALSLLSIFSFGQDAINYQGVCTASLGPVTNTTISISIDIIDSTAVGPIVYSETHSVMTNDKGLFSIEIGNGTPTFQSFDTINFATPTFMSIGLDTLGGSSYVNLGTSQFLSVPTAIYSQCAGEVLVKELNQIDYTINVASNIDVLLDVSIENILMPGDIPIFVYDASGNLLAKSQASYGFPTAGQVSISSTFMPGASKFVFYFNTINGLQKVTYN